MPGKQPRTCLGKPIALEKCQNGRLALKGSGKQPPASPSCCEQSSFKVVFRPVVALDEFFDSFKVAYLTGFEEDSQ